LGKNSQAARYKAAVQKKMSGLSGRVRTPKPIRKMGIRVAIASVTKAALFENNRALVR
jgi:hypothetical protein